MIRLAPHARLSTESFAATEAFETAVRLFALHRPGAGEAAAQASRADPNCLAALAFSGFMQVLLARRETLDAAGLIHAKAEAAMSIAGPSPGERALVEALGDASRGFLLKAAARLEAHLEEDPRDFTAFKLAHALRFMGGDEPGMLAATAKALPHWSPGMPGYGLVLGCHAFALGEAGRLPEAEITGHRALEHEPDDAWGIHAIAHVHEMRGMTKAGIVWLEQTRPVWSLCNNFGYHMAWHLALFQLKRGDVGGCLATYDAQVRPCASEDFRDIANATSVLWRISQHGLDTGGRWDELHAIARKRAGDTSLVFTSLHHLLSCLACGDQAGAARITGALETLCCLSGEQAGIAARVGAPLARALAGGRPGAGLDFADIARRLPAIGGSHVQRDVFLRALALLAAKAGDTGALQSVLEVRRAQRAPDCIPRMSADILEARGPFAKDASPVKRALKA